MVDSKTSGAIGGAVQGAAIGSTFGPVGTAVGGVLGGLAGLFGGGGEDEARELAKINADLVNITSLENQRRMNAERERSVGRMRAQIAASNILQQGSPERYIGEFEREALASLNFERNRSRLQQDAAIRGGEITADSISSASLGNMINSFGSAAGSGLFGSYSSSTGYQKPGWLG